MKKIARPTSLTDQAVEYLRDAITSGELVPGEHYSASTLGEMVGASRTPVREALLQLAQAGMVRIDKNRGATILSTSLDDLVEVFQVRLMVEVPATARTARVVSSQGLLEIREAFDAMRSAADEEDAEATLRADRDFHLAIMNHSGNARVVTVLRDLRNLVLTRGVGTAPSARTCQDVVDDHIDILRGIEAHNGPAAGEAMRLHVINTAGLLIDQESDGTFDLSTLQERLSWPNSLD